MLKILDSNTSVTKSLPKFVETGKGFLINGQYYTKELAPIPTAMSGDMMGMWKWMHINKTCMLNMPETQHYQQGFNRNDTLIIKDKFQNDIYYIFPMTCFEHISSAGTHMSTIQAKETDNSFQILRKIDNVPNGTTYGVPIEEAGQDERYLYVFFTKQYTYNEYGTNGWGNSTIIRFDKRDLSYTASDSLNVSKGYMDANSMVTSLYEDNTYIYFGHTTTLYPSTAIQRYNKVVGNITYGLTNTTTNKLQNGWEELYFKSLNPTHSHNESRYCLRKRLPKPIRKNNLLTTYDFIYNKSTDKYGFVEIVIDILEDDMEKVITTKEFIINDNLKIFPTTTTITPGMFCEMFIKEDNNEYYLNLILYSNDIPSKLTSDFIEQQGIYTFKILNNGIQFLGKTKVSSFSLNGFLTGNNNDFVVCPTFNSFHILHWDTVDKIYKISTSINSPCYSIGLDKDDNIWTMKLDGTLEMLNVTIPTQVTLQMKESSYKYEGEDIFTEVTLICKNYTGNRIATRFEIIIEGNAKFSDNNSKIITVNTSIIEDLKINVTIIGEGAIYIYPKLILN